MIICYDMMLARMQKYGVKGFALAACILLSFQFLFFPTTGAVSSSDHADLPHVVGTDSAPAIPGDIPTSEDASDCPHFCCTPLVLSLAHLGSFQIPDPRDQTSISLQNDLAPEGPFFSIEYPPQSV